MRARHQQQEQQQKLQEQQQLLQRQRVASQAHASTSKARDETAAASQGAPGAKQQEQQGRPSRIVSRSADPRLRQSSTGRRELRLPYHMALRSHQSAASTRRQACAVCQTVHSSADFCLIPSPNRPRSGSGGPAGEQPSPVRIRSPRLPHIVDAGRYRPHSSDAPGSPRVLPSLGPAALSEEGLARPVTVEQVTRSSGASARTQTSREQAIDRALEGMIEAEQRRILLQEREQQQLQEAARKRNSALEEKRQQQLQRMVAADKRLEQLQTQRRRTDYLVGKEMGRRVSQQRAASWSGTQYISGRLSAHM